MPNRPQDPRPFKRAILKLSGEALRGVSSRDNISPEIVDRIALEIREAVCDGLQLGVVVGGGNFWRGASASARGMDVAPFPALRSGPMALSGASRRKQNTSSNGNRSEISRFIRLPARPGDFSYRNTAPRRTETPLPTPL